MTDFHFSKKKYFCKIIVTQFHFTKIISLQQVKTLSSISLMYRKWFLALGLQQHTD